VSALDLKESKGEALVVVRECEVGEREKWRRRKRREKVQWSGGLFAIVTGWSE